MTISCKTMDQVMILNFSAEILRLKNEGNKETEKQLELIEKTVKNLRKIISEEEEKLLIVN